MVPEKLQAKEGHGPVIPSGFEEQKANQLTAQNEHDDNSRPNEEAINDGHRVFLVGVLDILVVTKEASFVRFRIKKDVGMQKRVGNDGKPQNFCRYRQNLSLFARSRWTTHLGNCSRQSAMRALLHYHTSKNVINKHLDNVQKSF